METPGSGGSVDVDPWRASSGSRFFARRDCVSKQPVEQNLVAAIETPSSHQGIERPLRKNSAVLDPARRAPIIPIANVTTSDATTIDQSKVVNNPGVLGRGP